MCRIDGEIGPGDGGALAGNVRIVSCLGAFGILRGALKRFFDSAFDVVVCYVLGSPGGFGKC